MKTPVIHLEHYNLEKVLIERIRNDGEQDIESFTISFDFDYKIQRKIDNENEFALTLIVRDDPKAKTPVPQFYKLDLQIIGFFRFEEGTEEETMQYLIRFNGCSILYGILRGILGTISGNFPEGALKMPTIMISDIVEKVEGPQKKAQKKVAKKKLKKPTKKVAKKRVRPTS